MHFFEGAEEETFSEHSEIEGLISNEEDLSAPNGLENLLLSDAVDEISGSVFNKIYNNLLSIAKETLKCKDLYAETTDKYFSSANATQRSHSLKAKASYELNFQSFLTTYQEIYTVFYRSQQTEQSPDPQHIPREAYRILECYSNAHFSGIEAYFDFLLNQIIADGKIDWSTIPGEVNINCLDDEDIDTELTVLMRPKPSNKSIGKFSSIKPMKPSIRNLSQCATLDECGSGNLTKNFGDDYPEEDYLYIDDEFSNGKSSVKGLSQTNDLLDECGYEDTDSLTTNFDDDYFPIDEFEKSLTLSQHSCVFNSVQAPLTIYNPRLFPSYSPAAVSSPISPSISGKKRSAEDSLKFSDNRKKIAIQEDDSNCMSGVAFHN